MLLRDDLIPYLNQTPINFTGAGDQTVVTGQVGTRIAVLQFFFVLSAAVTLTYKSGLSTMLSGPMPFLANGAQVQDFIQLPLMCNDGDNFVINAAASVTLGGTLWFARAPSVR